jgi:hypothetical protein
MNFDKETLDEILWGDNEDFVSATDTVIEDQTRWHVYKSKVFKQVSTGKFFEAYWGEGATEYQDGDDLHWSFIEVEPKEVMTVVYTTVQDGEKYQQ